MHERLKILPFGAGILKLELLPLSHVFSCALNSLRRHSLFQPTICSESKHQFFLSQQKMFSYSLSLLGLCPSTMILRSLNFQEIRVDDPSPKIQQNWLIVCEFIGRNKIETRGQN